MPSSIKCFKRFFKHTWHPQQMEESRSRFERGKTVGVGYNGNDTELGEVKIIETTLPSIATSNSIQVASTGSVVVPCGNGGCKTARNQRDHQSRHETPWHKLKTIFLLSIIIGLIVWVIVYTVLSQYEIL